mgnify:CR=1 FL=1
MVRLPNRLIGSSRTGEIGDPGPTRFSQFFEFFRLFNPLGSPEDLGIEFLVQKCTPRGIPLAASNHLFFTYFLIFFSFWDFFGLGGPFRAPVTSELNSACKTNPGSGLRTFRPRDQNCSPIFWKR